ncbi:hypothetical protein RSP795_22525 [Ralstonia solanacearum]|uniref:RHS repeat-associated core domain-containing protein n=1 Tax=Ralstonia solanacearum TaxID=305 RepID=UPI0007D7B4E4|nr:RHS repeat-associated core domain-containing protein [Ralstonia solanacearum]OAI58867.1 hypothetical protein RSP795_22525 [Ralstonia solanacearum]
MGVVVSGYDAADRLLADDSRNWSDRRYSYDAADNRTSATSRTAKQTIVPNALNQMQTVNGQPTQYDAAGNLLEDEARQYDWDAEHRLIRIRYKAQAGKETRFGYDGLGRRTVITEVDGTGTTETHYIWCGEAICQKRDANGQLLRAYYPEGESGPEIGKRVAKADTGTETDADGDEHDGRDQDGDDGKSAPQTESTGSLIYARNHLGSVTDTLTPDGRAVTHTEYGPYGELVKSQGRAEYRSDFGYAGMQYHAASGMYLTLFRAYDPGTGRWVSRDPIGERGGFNLYGYVHGNPVSLIDRLGLATREQINAAVQVLRESFPEVLAASPNSVTGVAGLSGVVGNPLAGKTDLSGNIQYNADLYGADGVPVKADNLDDFLQTIAHEMQHLNEGWQDRVGVNVGEWIRSLTGHDCWSIEDQIDHNADVMYQRARKKFMQRLGS